MVSSDRPVSLEDEVSHSMKEMIGGCCVCSDERGWAENPLVYCDGHGCSVAVHQGKHPTARLAEPGLLPTVTASPTLAATASSLSPLPRPAPPRPVPRPGIDSEGPLRGAGGVGCACGRKCVWPGLSCDSTLTLSNVIWPPPAPEAVVERLSEAAVGAEGWGASGSVCAGGWACASLSCHGGCGCGFGHVETPPPSGRLPFAAVCLGISCGKGIRLGTQLIALGSGGGQGSLRRFRLGREAPASAPQASWRRLLLWTGELPGGEDGGRSPPQSCCCRNDLAELPWAAG